MTEFAPAKRGDIAYVHMQKSVYTMYTGSYNLTDMHLLGRVVSVTRDGVVKKVIPFGNYSGTPLTPSKWLRVLVVSRARFKDDAAYNHIVEIASRRQASWSGYYEPFKSLNEIRNILRPACLTEE